MELQELTTLQKNHNEEKPLRDKDEEKPLRDKDVETPLRDKDDDENVPEKRKFRDLVSPKAQLILSYVSLTLISFLAGWNSTSFKTVMNVTLSSEDVSLYGFEKEFLDKLPPIFYHIGGFFTTIALFKYEFNTNKQLIGSCLLQLIAYIASIPFSNILVIYATRLILGGATACYCIVIPQILHTMAPKKHRAVCTAIFPLLLMIGLTVAVGIGYFDEVYFFYYITSFPVILSLLCLVSLCFSVSFKNPAHDKNDTSVYKFVFDSAMARSILYIIVIHILTKITGIDLLLLFSDELFEEDNKYRNSVLTLLMATVFSFLGGIVSDRVGRKIPAALGLVSIAIICFLIDRFGINIWFVGLFMFSFYCGLNSIPFVYQNEVVPPQFKARANELGGVTGWCCGLLMTSLIACLFTKQNTRIFAICGCMSLIGFIMVSFCMKETLGLETFEFIQSCFHIGSWYRAKEKNGGLQIP